MRRRTIIKEFTDGQFKIESGRTGVGLTEPAGQYRQCEIDVQQGFAQHSRRHSYVRERELAERDEQVGKEQVDKIEVEREEQRPLRIVVKGVCRKCGRHIGKGIAMHERHCK